jgi:hypothetical protein
MSLIQVNSITARTGTTVTVLSNLNLQSVQAGTIVNNLGIDSTGKVIIGSAGGSGSTANISDALYTVNNLSANGTSSATTSVCIYGVNVFTGASGTNYATKLPQPVTGKSVKIVNNTTYPISMYPANVGGKINNLPINTPLVIPADGKVYEYICTLNPLPGNFSGPTPLTAIYDSGVMTHTVTGGTVSGGVLVSGARFDRVGQQTGAFAPNAWFFADNVANSPKILPDYNGGVGNYTNVNFDYGGLYHFAGDVNWSGIKKITVYTNLTKESTIRLGLATWMNVYDVVTNQHTTIAGRGNSRAGDSKLTANVMKGTILNPSSIVQPNVDSPGTYFDTIEYGVNGFGPLNSGFDSFVGDRDEGIMSWLVYNTPTNFKTITSSRLTFTIKPSENYNYGATLTNFKVRFVIEYFI